MTTIVSHDGKLTVHGSFVKWVDEHGGFEFDAPYFRHQYCNTDFWRIIFDHNFTAPVGRITVVKE
jgi:hypothetical protein